MPGSAPVIDLTAESPPNAAAASSRRTLEDLERLESSMRSPLRYRSNSANSDDYLLVDDRTVIGNTSHAASSGFRRDNSSAGNTVDIDAANTQAQDGDDIHFVRQSNNPSATAQRRPPRRRGFRLLPSPSTGPRIATRTGTIGLSARSHAAAHSRGGWPAIDSNHIMQLVGTHLQRLRSGYGVANPEGASAAEPAHIAVPESPATYDIKMTHPYPAEFGFSNSIIEPPVDLETFFDDRLKVNGPLPDTTPICPGCHYALVTGGNQEHRIWALPCGHVIDGRCVDRLSRTTKAMLPPITDASPTGKRKDKSAIYIDLLDDEPPVKVARRSQPATEGEVRRKLKSPRFLCPVPGCGQKCSKGDDRYAAWKVFE